MACVLRLASRRSKKVGAVGGAVVRSHLEKGSGVRLGCIRRDPPFRHRRCVYRRCHVQVHGAPGRTSLSTHSAAEAFISNEKAPDHAMAHFLTAFWFGFQRTDFCGYRPAASSGIQPPLNPRLSPQVCTVRFRHTDLVLISMFAWTCAFTLSSVCAVPSFQRTQPSHRLRCLLTLPMVAPSRFSGS